MKTNILAITFFFTKDYSNISGIERSGVYPEKIEQKPMEEIEKSILNKKPELAYALVCHERGNLDLFMNQYLIPFINSDFHMSYMHWQF